MPSSSRDRRTKYIEYMSEKLVDLYLLLDNDPLSLFKSSRDEAAGKRLEPLKSIEDLIIYFQHI